jgi:TonB family protein
MPRGRLLSICIAASVALHVLATVGLFLLPSTRRAAPEFVPVELAEMPRATDFLEPAPGIVQGGPPPVPPPAPQRPAPPAPQPQAAAPRAPEPAPKAAPAAPAPPPQGEPSGSPEAPQRPAEPQAQAQEKPAPGSATEKPSPAAKEPVPSKQPAGNSAAPSPPKPLRKLIPSLGELARAPGEPGGPRSKSSGGSAVATDGKPREKGQITEESGGGVHLSSLNSPEIQYMSWYDSIKKKIELVWVYPLEAAQAGIQGEVTIDFVIERNGSVSPSSIRLVKSSGYKVLDDEAIRAIQVVGRARFNPIPKSYNIPNLAIRGRFMYVQGGIRELR